MEKGNLSVPNVVDKVNGKIYNIANEIMKHIIKRPRIVIYKNTNGVIYEDVDSFTKKIIGDLEEKLEISRTQSPLVVKESINYQIVPSLIFKYRHIVTGERTLVSLIDVSIAEDEKKILLKFGGIGELTYKEQMEVLNILNSKEMPPLSKEDVFFYDDNVKINIISRLKAAAQIDGTASDAESKFIGEIASLL